MADNAADFEPLIARIYEVLCEGRGAHRTLAVGQRFRAKLLSTESDAMKAKNARVQKLVLAAIDRFDDSVQTQEFSDRAEYATAIRVDLAYSTANPYDRARVIEQMTAAASDAHRVRMALGWPPNMVTTEAGVSTGLSGGGLVFKNASGGRLSPDSKLFTITLAFTATVWLAMPVS